MFFRPVLSLCLFTALTGAVASAALEDLAVAAVTDMTAAGRAAPAASPENPVYYQAVTTGYRDFGRGIGREREPENDPFLQVVLRALKREGYIPATDEHPPSLVLGLSWGSLRQDPGAALSYLGGDKVGLMWEVEPKLGLEPGVWLRGLRSATADRVMELSQQDLFVMTIAAYDRPALIRGNVVLLWQTRIACPTRGVWAADALPQIVQTAASVIGRETQVPQLTTVRDAFGQAGEVTIGELKVEEEDFDLNTLPVLDLTKEPVE